MSGMLRAVTGKLKEIASDIVTVRLGTVISDNAAIAQTVVTLDNDPDSAQVQALSGIGTLPAQTRVAMLAYPPRGLIIFNAFSGNSVFTLQDELDAAFPLGTGVWPDYTPTLVQSGAVTKTVTYARRSKVNREVTAQMEMSVTGAGVAGNVVLFGLPEPAAGPAQLAIGSADLFDASANLFYAGTAVLHDANQAKFVISGFGNYAGIAGFSAALAAGDFMTIQVKYESTT